MGQWVVLRYRLILRCTQNAAPSTYDFGALDRALTAFNDRIFAPLAENQGKGEIALTNAMMNRFNTLARCVLFLCVPRIYPEPHTI